MRHSLLCTTIALAALILTGCAADRYPDSYEVRISPTMTATQQQLALEAMDEWTRAISRLTLSPTIGTCPENPGRSTICIEIGAPGSLAIDAWGVTSTSKEIQINGDLGLTDDQLRQTMAHEFGHAMGLVHTGPGTLMAPSEKLGAAMTVQSGDVEQWFSVR